MKIILSLLLCVTFTSVTFGQYDHESVYKNLDGTALRNALTEKYKPKNVLSYGVARDYLYSEVDIHDGKLSCVYTGYTINMNPNNDPSNEALRQNINTEHTVPRSKGAYEGSLGYSDMHHLFPTRDKVNSARSNYPFKEIQDKYTDQWFRNNGFTRTIPTSNIDEYSEFDNYGYFEPREDHKGDVARAYFYFYTMYKENVDRKDANFFKDQQETMCDWHFKDPVSEKEWNRNIAIARGQGNKNPFVLDCSLARLYCKDLLGTCQTVDVENINNNTFSISNNSNHLLVKGHPNNSVLTIYSTTGQLVSTITLPNEEAVVNTTTLTNGIYIVRIHNNEKEIGVTKIIR